MEIHSLKPRRGSDTYRIDDSDDFVVMENIGTVPAGKICLKEHSVLFICTEGRAQFEYDGTVVQFQKNDIFLYMVNSIACNFMASSDFNCRQIWFVRSEIWNINIYNRTSLSDMSHFKLHPVVHLTHDDVILLDNYFRLLCHRMSDHSPVIYHDIVRSLACTMMLELLAMFRRTERQKAEASEQMNTLPGIHKRKLVDQFMQLVEQSDGRIRKVDEYANRLNITPKYLSTILKEILNRRPSVYIQLFTMKAIEQRLRFTDMTMQEIANDLHFPNASFFGKYFKEHSGMTPLEFRMKYHRGEMDTEGHDSKEHQFDIYLHNEQQEKND